MARPARSSMAVSRMPSRIMAPIVGPGMAPITLRVNQQAYRLTVEPRRSLLDAIRTDLGLTGAKRVCNLGECGACTVLIDGHPVYSCIALALECQNRDIVTIEGLSADGNIDPVQEAFIRCDAVQCGFCTPGQVLATKSLLAENAQPSDEEIRRALAGNLCRCGTYARIREAIRDLTAGVVPASDEEQHGATDYQVPHPGLQQEGPR